MTRYKDFILLVAKTSLTMAIEETKSMIKSLGGDDESSRDYFLMNPLSLSGTPLSSDKNRSTVM